ncbi:thiamine phosphate synthase [Paracoccus aerodenitrificans]|uniref:thiamine phosphate synthase n=1 Tax=Paracoccus aerodenitrificans TaxID=3017781 RepID=UPI0022F056B1|nr:thiamine phosphate synthase [Paracoccus aerodenitrificans]WBU65043.1 thiamine phosphate synthase [Paracoccus aerodenitrificans]
MTDQPDAPVAPQLYLITPVGAEPGAFGPILDEMLERFQIACIRIPGAGDEAQLGRMADTVRDLAHARDVAVVIDDHIALAQRHGLDGVHLSGGAKQVRYARKELGADAIIGAFCGTSRHDGMAAGEAGADYVSFGPAGATALGTGEAAPLDLFAWWSEMIEVPVVAEGGLDAALIGKLTPITDFFALGPEIWAEDDPVTALSALWR